MDYHDLLSNFDELTNRLHREVKYNSDPLTITDINREIEYVKKRMEDRGTADTSFTKGEEGTVNITVPSGSATAPGVEFVEDPNDLLPDVMDAYNDSFDADWDNIEERLSKLKKVLKRPNGKEKIVLDPRNKYVRELVRRSSVKTLNDGTEVLMFRSERGIDKGGVQIMKRGKTSIPTYSKNSTALREYKELVRKIKDELITSTQGYVNKAFGGDDVEPTTVDQDDVDTMFEDIELIDVKLFRDDIPGLSPTENRELRGVLNLTDTTDPESRVCENGALQKQVEYFQDAINKTMELREKTDDTEEFIRLEERIVAVREARDRTVMQKEVEEGRQAQVEDISRFRVIPQQCYHGVRRVLLGKTSREVDPEEYTDQKMEELRKMYPLYEDMNLQSLHDEIQFLTEDRDEVCDGIEKKKDKCEIYKRTVGGYVSRTF
ncbi:Hypothetical predicted protein [Paramuricea clavata]|uniref:Uncharacterized protein n=1 Tax=Paramuricea clavata TaxID=317549 RepID=A0A6S7HHK9_PARCT|nr:Hypothetical predicted protein [Paramuricea clavata]